MGPIRTLWDQLGHYGTRLLEKNYYMGQKDCYMYIYGDRRTTIRGRRTAIRDRRTTKWDRKTARWDRRTTIWDRRTAIYTGQKKGIEAQTYNIQCRHIHIGQYPPLQSCLVHNCLQPPLLSLAQWHKLQQTSSALSTSRSDRHYPQGPEIHGPRGYFAGR